MDILYLAKSRVEFTIASMEALTKNTTWPLVKRLVFYDDGSSQEDRNVLASFSARLLCEHNILIEIYDTSLGAPVAIMNDYLSRPGSNIFAKVDNDAMMPPGWLDAALGVMKAHPELGMLGLEPPASRTLGPGRTLRRDPPELTGPITVTLGHTHGYAKCKNVGGIALIRRSIFSSRDKMQPHSIYGGFGEWQNNHPEVTCGWITPPIKVFVLDRLPMAPWRELSDKYIRDGLQRPWTNYSTADKALWDWWTP